MLNESITVKTAESFKKRVDITNIANVVVVVQ